MTALILHIGTEKTGTTSIQEFLGINRAALAEQGLHVPEFLGARTHRWAAYMAENVDRIDHFSKELGLACLLYTSPSPRDRQKSRMPSSA